MHPAGHAVGGGAIDTHQHIAVAAIVHDRQQVVAAHPDRGARRKRVRQPAGNERADAIVAALGIADADHQDRSPRRHRRVTFRSRKWVEHEMQGS